MRKKPKEWIPDAVWLNIVALSNMDAFRDIPDSVFRNDGLWRQWYDQEAPEMAKVGINYCQAQPSAKGFQLRPQPGAAACCTAHTARDGVVRCSECLHQLVRWMQRVNCQPSVSACIVSAAGVGA